MNRAECDAVTNDVDKALGCLSKSSNGCKSAFSFCNEVESFEDRCAGAKGAVVDKSKLTDVGTCAN